MPLSFVAMARVKAAPTGAELASPKLADVDAPHDGLRTCFHCGQPNPATSSWRAVCDGGERRFCCAGCLAVAQTIRAAGLDQFYRRRDASSGRPPEIAGDDEAARHADAAEAAGLVVHLDDDLRETALLLEGIRCAACVWLIEAYLRRQPGVLAVNVNFATRRARLQWNTRQTQLSALLRAVGAIGYRAYPYDPARREALARREGRALLARTALALLAAMQVMMFAAPGYLSADGVEPEYQRLLEWASLALTLPVVLYSAAPFRLGALRELRARQRAGEAIEAIAHDLPETAERLTDHPQTTRAETVAANRLRCGDWIRIAAGAPIPADGDVVEGRSHVEEAVLTGESWPQAKAPGNTVLAGSINRESPLIVRVTASGAATTLAALGRLVERAASGRPRVARLADRVAAWFVAALLAIGAAPAFAWWQLEPARALAVTFAVLVVSCPCALSLATPAALAAAAGALGRRGVLAVRGEALETLSR